LERSLEPLLGSPGILRVGYTKERDFWRYAVAVDGCINLRYPAAGETSGIAIPADGHRQAGHRDRGLRDRPVSGFCLPARRRRVAEEEMLAEYMVWLPRYPEDARAIGQRASAHIASFTPWSASQACIGGYEDCYYKSNGN